jgi:hypothetical protein
MAFADWMDFTSEFRSTFCPENEATSALMRLQSDCYFQCQRNVEAYIDEFRDLVDMSGYTDPTAIVLKYRQGLNATTQDKIAESGTGPCDPMAPSGLPYLEYLVLGGLVL